MRVLLYYAYAYVYAYVCATVRANARRSAVVVAPEARVAPLSRTPAVTAYRHLDRRRSSSSMQVWVGGILFR